MLAAGGSRELKHFIDTWAISGISYHSSQATLLILPCLESKKFAVQILTVGTLPRSRLAKMDAPKTAEDHRDHDLLERFPVFPGDERKPSWLRSCW